MAINLSKPGINPFAPKPSKSWAEFYFNMAVDMLEATLWQQGTNVAETGINKLSSFFGFDILSAAGVDKGSLPNIISNAIFAKNLSEEYDKVIKSGFTLFPLPGRAFQGGNANLMGITLLGILNKTKLDKNGDLLRDIGPAIQAYWVGASHSKLPIPNTDSFPPPKFPAIGAVSNISTSIGFCFSPGVWTPLIVAPNGEPAPFLLNFIISANLHLMTLTGMYFVQCAYPPPAPPGPGVSPWQSYFTYPISPTLFTGRAWKDIIKTTGRAAATRISEVGLEVLGASAIGLTNEAIIGNGDIGVEAYAQRIVAGFTDAGTNPNLTPSQKEGIAAILNPDAIKLGSEG
jgi:hypothetical protein